MCSRPFWTTRWVLGESELLSMTLSQQTAKWIKAHNDHTLELGLVISGNRDEPGGQFVDINKLYAKWQTMLASHLKMALSQECCAGTKEGAKEWSASTSKNKLTGDRSLVGLLHGGIMAIVHSCVFWSSYEYILSVLIKKECHMRLYTNTIVWLLAMYICIKTTPYSKICANFYVDIKKI